MTIAQDMVSAHVDNLIIHGRRVYDCDGTKIGFVELHDIQPPVCPGVESS